MKAKVHPSQETLRTYFEVANDKFVRKIRTGCTTNIGDIVEGYITSRGRRYMKFNNEHFAYARLIWIYFNGQIPDMVEIDHIDCNPLNDSVNNLRLATRNQNSHNKNEMGSNTGYKDITKYSKTKNCKVYWYYLVGVKANGVVNRKNFPCTTDGLKSAIEYRNSQIEKLHGVFGRID